MYLKLLVFQRGHSLDDMVGEFLYIPVLWHVLHSHSAYEPLVANNVDKEVFAKRGSV